MRRCGCSGDDRSMIPAERSDGKDQSKGTQTIKQVKINQEDKLQMKPRRMKKSRFHSLMMIGFGLLAFCIIMPEATVRAV